MLQSGLKGWSRPEARLARSASSTVVLRGWSTGQAGRALGRLAVALAFGAAVVAVASATAGAAAAQQPTPPTPRSTKLQQPDSVLCDTAPVKLVRRVPVKPKAAAGHRRKVVRPKPVVPAVVAKPVVKKPRPAVAKAAGHRARPKVVAPRKPNCVKATAVAVAPTPEAKKALVAALPWTAPAEVAMPEISPFSLPGTIGSRSNAWALGLAGLSAFYFVGHDRTPSSVVVPPPPPPSVVPEPASIALLATGLAGIGAGAGLQRRRRRRSS